MNTKAKIDEALTDVRKAYRLLHDYQRAALDVATYIGAQLGFTYNGGWTHFSDHSAPRDGGGKLEWPSWCWLNLMFYEFYFIQKITENDILELSIWLFSDTGYFIGDNAVKTDVATFALVENSGTKVGFLLYRGWEGEFSQLLTNDKDAVRRFLENEGELPGKLKEAKLLGKCCDFSRLSDSKSTDIVLGELVQMAQLNDFPLKQMNKAG